MVQNIFPIIRHKTQYCVMCRLGIYNYTWVYMGGYINILHKNGLNIEYLLYNTATYMYMKINSNYLKIEEWPRDSTWLCAWGAWKCIVRWWGGPRWTYEGREWLSFQTKSLTTSNNIQSQISVRKTVVLWLSQRSKASVIVYITYATASWPQPWYNYDCYTIHYESRKKESTIIIGLKAPPNTHGLARPL